MIQKALKTLKIKQMKQLQVTVLAAMSVVMLQLAGCSSPMPSRAPVEDRNPVGQGGKSNQGTQGNPGNQGNQGNQVGTGKPISDTPVFAPIDSKPLPNLTNSVNAGKPGYYTVKPGDTIFQVGRVTGQNAKDIIRWNNLENPNQIETGQVLRVVPPEVSNGAVTPVKPPVVAPATPATPMPATASTPATADDDIAWMWPNGGSVICGYDETCRGSKNKGLQIAGKAGDPVFASADGRVVYAGSAVRGYGNLVILKHNETYLTAYAHNQTLLVKEDQTVRKGQRIADMGSSDAERVMLGFEVRRLGKPVDPSKYLPVR
jgi:lipoprotein NlpD